MGKFLAALGLMILVDVVIVLSIFAIGVGFLMARNAGPFDGLGDSESSIGLALMLVSLVFFALSVWSFCRYVHPLKRRTP